MEEATLINLAILSYIKVFIIFRFLKRMISDREETLLLPGGYDSFDFEILGSVLTFLLAIIVIILQLMILVETFR